MDTESQKPSIPIPTCPLSHASILHPHVEVLLLSTSEFVRCLALCVCDEDAAPALGELRGPQGRQSWHQVMALLG